MQIGRIWSNWGGKMWGGKVSNGLGSRHMGTAIVWAVFLAGCGGREVVVKEAPRSMRPALAPEWREEARELQNLVPLLDEHIQFFDQPKHQRDELVFGAVTVAAQDYNLALKELRARFPAEVGQIEAFIRDHFDYLEVQGEGKWGQVFITSYFEPLINVRRKADAEHFRPIYGVPKDMVLLQLEPFFERAPDWFARTERGERRAPASTRGRWIEKAQAKIVMPYWSREEIDSLGFLRNLAPVMAFADPWDAFVLQIQGSGTLRFEDGKELRVNYAAQNGWPYVPIGRKLKEKNPNANVTMDAIENEWRKLSWREQQDWLNFNPSYVFFQPTTSAPRTSLGTSVFAGRTIATDRRFFPKGALALLKAPSADWAKDPKDWPLSFRLVMDQDTGGAIRGTDRVDLFWGRGADAKRASGVVKHWGSLGYWMPKMSWLAELKAKSASR